MIRFLLFFLTAFSLTLSAQTTGTYPSQDFINPLGIKNYLAGNFAELRNNHFHSGIDIKTNQKEGYNIYSVADGYVSRIKISARGYGNALYITHPNGYTTVYGHMQRFSDRINNYAKRQQYTQQSFEVDLYLAPETLSVRQKEIIGLSGNSGGSGGPHLHYEVRDTKTEEPINPFLFGHEVADNSKPQINGLYIYALEGEVLGKSSHQLPKGLSFTSPIYASGKIGFGIKTYDKHDGASNNNGTYSIDLRINGEKVFTYRADRFFFHETRKINALMDYPNRMINNSWIYQCYNDPGTNLTLFHELKENGILTLTAGKSYRIQFTVKDFAGNSNQANFIIKGRSSSKEIRIPKGTFFSWDKDNTYHSHNIDLSFPKGTFYRDFYFNYSTTPEGGHRVHNNNTPVQKHFNLAIKPVGINPALLNKAVITRSYLYRGKWKKDYLLSEYKNGKIITTSRDFGIFKIAIDQTAPSISPINIKSSGSKLSHSIKFRINDHQSGIKDYQIYIDDQWTLAVHDRKNHLLSLKLKEEGISNGPHKITVIVTDKKQNTRTFSANFTKI